MSERNDFEREVLLPQELEVVTRFQKQFCEIVDGTDMSVSIRNGAIILLAKNKDELDYLESKFNNPDYRFEGNYAIRCISK